MTNDPSNPVTPSASDISMRVVGDALEDRDGNGLAEHLRVDVAITNTASTGISRSLTIAANLFGKQGELIDIGTLDIVSERSVPSVQFVIPDQPGPHITSIYFSGRNLRSFTLDGPYQVTIRLRDELGKVVAFIRYTTQVHHGQSFQGLLAQVQSIRDEAITKNTFASPTHGYYNLLCIHVLLNMQAAGRVRIQSPLYAGKVYLGSDDQTIDLPQGAQTVTLNYSGTAIHAMNLDGPYTLYLVINDAHNSFDTTHTTALYLAQDFE